MELYCLIKRHAPRSPRFPYTTLFRSLLEAGRRERGGRPDAGLPPGGVDHAVVHLADRLVDALEPARSEEHTSELQSQSNLVCRLLLEKKNTQKRNSAK